jgi:hypothetical protein
MSRSWTFIVPPTATSVTAPQMPAEASSWLPDNDAGAPFFDDPEVEFGESDAIPGYREFRAGEGLVVPNREPLEDMTLLMPTNATLKVTGWKQLPQ